MASEFRQIGDQTVEVEVLRGYISDSSEALKQAQSYKTEFTTVVELAAKATGLDKKVLSAYFKARFKEATKEASKKGELFEALDEALAS
jgi:hypothetical protein